MNIGGILKKFHQRFVIFLGCERFLENLQGLKLLTRFPDFVCFFSISGIYEIAFREALKLKIPTISFVDTNEQVSNTFFCIPSNDDSPAGLELQINLFRELILRNLKKNLFFEMKQQTILDANILNILKLNAISFFVKDTTSPILNRQKNKIFQKCRGFKTQNSLLQSSLYFLFKKIGLFSVNFKNNLLPFNFFFSFYNKKKKRSFFLNKSRLRLVLKNQFYKNFLFGFLQNKTNKKSNKTFLNYKRNLLKVKLLLKKLYSKKNLFLKMKVRHLQKINDKNYIWLYENSFLTYSRAYKGKAITSKPFYFQKTKVYKFLDDLYRYKKFYKFLLSYYFVLFLHFLQNKKFFVLSYRSLLKVSFTSYARLWLSYSLNKKKSFFFRRSFIFF